MAFDEKHPPEGQWVSQSATLLPKHPANARALLSAEADVGRAGTPAAEQIRSYGRHVRCGQATAHADERLIVGPPDPPIQLR